MRRECTANENEIIKQNIDKTLVPMEMINSTANTRSARKVVFLFLGIILGTIISVAILINFDGLSKGTVKLAVLLCMGLVYSFFAAIGKLIDKKNAKRKMKSGNDRYYVMGGTCMGYVNEYDKLQIIYMVDEAKDNFGNLYCIKNPANEKVIAAIGERILVLTSNDGKILPMKITEETKNMISLIRPAEHENVNVNAMRMVPHPNVFRMDRNQSPVYEQEFESLIKSHRLIRRRFKIPYKKIVMFASQRSEWKGSTIIYYMDVYEIVEGNVMFRTYSWNYNNCLPKTVKYGDLIYKYSKDLDGTNKNIYWFCPIKNA